MTGLVQLLAMKASALRRTRLIGVRWGSGRGPGSLAGAVDDASASALKYTGLDGVGGEGSVHLP